MEALLLLIPLFLLFIVIFAGLIAVSVHAKKREAEEAKAASSKSDQF